MNRYVWPNIPSGKVIAGIVIASHCPSYFFRYTVFVNEHVAQTCSDELLLNNSVVYCTMALLATFDRYMLFYSDTVLGYVSYVVDLNRFYVQRSADIGQIERLQEQIRSTYEVRPGNDA